MKKLLSILLVVGLIAFSCESDDTGKEANKPPTCEIISPKDGAIHDVNTDLVIKGDAKDEDGTIEKVTLTVGGETVADVSKVPFEVTVKADQLTEGPLAIVLQVEDNEGLSAKQEISITVQDNALAPECKITAPAHGEELNVFAPFVIKGEGDAKQGEMKRVTLKINDKEITDVAEVPFEYTVAAESLPTGMTTIELEVENTGGRIDKDQISIVLSDLNLAPTCRITDPSDEDTFEEGDVIVVKGTGDDPDGTIEKVVLKVKGNVVDEVTSVPFEYTIPAELVVSGSINISLEVEDNNGKNAVDQITVFVLGMHREFTDPRDGKVYKTVKLGEQEWFAENLAWLPVIHSPDQGSEDAGFETYPFYYVYGYEGTDVNEAKATVQFGESGVLYNFWAMINGEQHHAQNEDMKVPSGIQGACPDGWHVPSRGEWWILRNWCYDQVPDEEGVWESDKDGHALADGSVRLCKNIMGRLKARNAGWATNSMWSDEFPDCNNPPTDEWGFGWFPSGVRFKDFHEGSYYKYYAGGTSTSGYFWTPEWRFYNEQDKTGGGGVVSSGHKYDISFGSGGTDASRAYSVRCVKD